MEIRASKDKGCHIGGPHDKDYNIFGACNPTYL